MHNFDSWYQRLEDRHEDHKLDLIEKSNLYEEYLEQSGNSEELEEVC